METETKETHVEWTILPLTFEWAEPGKGEEQEQRGPGARYPTVPAQSQE